MAGDTTIVIRDINDLLALATLTGNEKIEISDTHYITTNQLKAFATYVLQIASATTLGGVKKGNGLNISTDGTLSLSAPTASTIGGVKAGANITIAADGTISATSGGGEVVEYILPIATESVLGGVKVGGGISIDANGKISVTPYTLPQASTSVLGGVKVGDGLQVNSGVLSVKGFKTRAVSLSTTSSTSIVFNSNCNEVVYIPNINNSTANWTFPISVTLQAGYIHYMHLKFTGTIGSNQTVNLSFNAGIPVYGDTIIDRPASNDTVLEISFMLVTSLSGSYIAITHKELT